MFGRMNRPEGPRSEGGARGALFQARDPLAGGGEMGALLRTIDWAGTPLGPVDTWPTSLRTTVGIALGNRFPTLIWWSRDFIQIYNDAYRPILGDKHPASMGRSGPEVWSEIWHIVGPMAMSIFDGGPATWSEHLMLPMRRRGFVEETTFTFSYSPIPDDDGAVGGVLVTCQETTDQVLDARQLRALRDLGARMSGGLDNPHAACVAAARLLEDHAADVPFALLYLVDPDGRAARLVCTAGLADYAGPAKPETIDLLGNDRGPWPLREVLDAGSSRVLRDLVDRVGVLPDGPWPEPPHTALVVPIAGAERANPLGFLVAGTSPRRVLDERYAGFFKLLADQIGQAVTNARAREGERRRAESLAALDRAKTVFFSNVSHEFRTPLTLILGSLEEALLSSDEALAGPSLEMTHRNAVRLLRLVNSLLDFARIEAGRIQATFVPTDLGRFTADLASLFRAAAERAGLRLVIDADVGEPVYVDRNLWEKVVLNLLSNALKFTFEGEIRIQAREAPGSVTFEFRDTGVGVAADQLGKIFERFHRVEGTRARTHEGSGIGLALVQEIVRLHGGDIQVQSQTGRGTTFTVTLQKGHTHLPADRLGRAMPAEASGSGAAAYVEEVWRWVADDEPEAGAVENTRLRRAAEGERNRLRALLGQVPAIVNFFRGPDLVFEFAHPKAIQVFGGRDVVGKPLLEALPELAHQDSPQMLRQVMETGQRFEGREKLVRHADGQGGLRDSYWDYVHLPVKDAQGRVEGVMTFDVDVTEQVRARQKMEEQAVALAEANREAQRARSVAETANRAKDEFLAMLGHELRNPLSPIVTALELLELKGERSREFHVIGRQVNHLIRLVDDLLDVSRIARGKIDLRRRKVEIANILLKAVELASPLLERRRQRLDLDVPPQGLVVFVDPDRMAQVISNLLTNAAKYSDEGTTVRLGAERSGESVLVRVVDQGVGIAPDMLEKIFDSFVQKQQASDRSGGGLGLGLTIARSLVELHGGEVRAQSAGLGRGSEFVVELSAVAVDAPDTTVAALSASSRRSGGETRILVVDDNDDAAFLTADLLRNLGFEVRVAHDGPAALAIAESFHPDIALLDIGLPVMDGYELARRLRDQDSTAHVKLVAITGYGQDSDRRRSQEVGFAAHLVKPVDLALLTKVLAN